MVFGLLVIDKPAGLTSHDVVAAVRKGTRERRVGHAGTLDPLATGVLILALGQATRLLEYIIGHDKAYQAEVTLGIETTTYDVDGEIVTRQPIPATLDQDLLEAVLAKYQGQIIQKPPVYSALKVGGKPAYARARAGEQVELTPRQVQIHRLELKRFDPPVIGLEVTCSAGTYIRSLAHDLGAELGCGAVLSALRRTASGDFALDTAVPLGALQQAFDAGNWQQFLLPGERALFDMPHITLEAQEVNSVIHGIAVPWHDVSDGPACAYTPNGHFFAVLAGDPAEGLWRPRKVFAFLANPG